MKVCLLILMFVLLVICFIFQVRDIYIMKKYKRTDNDRFECGHLQRQTNRKGYTISECENPLCREAFKKNNDNCPSKCRGRIYADAPQSLEVIFSADNFYCAKKIAYLIGTVFSSVLTILNIIDKI